MIGSRMGSYAIPASWARAVGVQAPGAVGDLHEVLPALSAATKKAKGA